MLTSDGRAYLVRWAPPRRSAVSPGASSSSLLLSPVSEGGAPGGGGGGGGAAGAAAERWTWEGVCFHPAADGATGVDVEAVRERELDRGKGASCGAVNEGMGLVAVGCEECVCPLALSPLPRALCS